MSDHQTSSYVYELETEIERLKEIVELNRELRRAAEDKVINYSELLSSLLTKFARYKEALEDIVNQTTTCEKDWQAYKAAQKIARLALEDK